MNLIERPLAEVTPPFKLSPATLQRGKFVADNSQKNSRIWVISAIFLMIVLAFVSYQSRQEAHAGSRAGGFEHGQLKIRRADGSEDSLRVEIAKTPAQQELGLMFRKELAPDAGMIFIWPADQPVSMWMKNTILPLDMLFIDHDGIIVRIAANAVPYDLTPIPSGQPIRAVIEIGNGEASKQNIKVGDKILYPGFGQ